MERFVLGIVGPGLVFGYGVVCVALQKAWLLGPGSVQTQSFADDIAVTGGAAIFAGLYFMALGLLLHLVAYWWWPAAAAEEDPNGSANKRLGLGVIGIIIFVIGYAGVYLVFS